MGKLTSAERAQKGLVSNRAWFVLQSKAAGGWFVSPYVLYWGVRRRRLPGSFSEMDH